MRERTNKTIVTSIKEKVPLKGLENVKLLATLDILNPRPKKGLKKFFSSKVKQSKMKNYNKNSLKRIKTAPQLGPTTDGKSSPIVRSRVLATKIFLTLGPTADSTGSLPSLVKFCLSSGYDPRTYRRREREARYYYYHSRVKDFCFSLDDHGHKEKVARSLTFSSPFKGTFSLLLITLVLFVPSLTSWTKFYALEDHSTSFGIGAIFNLNSRILSEDSFKINLIQFRLVVQYPFSKQPEFCLVAKIGRPIFARLILFCLSVFQRRKRHPKPPGLLSRLTGTVEFHESGIGDREGRKSTTSYFFTLAGNSVSWKSQLQPVVDLSTAQAEYIAATQAIKEAFWLQGLLSKLHLLHSIIFTDSQSCLHLCKNPVYHERTKPIDVKYNFIRERVSNGIVNIDKISTKDNPADFGTKVATTDKFVLCRDLLCIKAELQSLRDEMRDIRRDVTTLSNQQREVSPHRSLNVTTPWSNGPFNRSKTTSSTNLHILMKNFIHLLTMVEKAVLEEEACLDTLKKFQDHKLGMESHYMKIMNIQVATTKPPTSNFKPWPKKEEAPGGTFQPSIKPKMEEREIGAYKDEILCDMVPMQSCHLLLGRPWQFDRKSLHNGENNTYSFVKDGRTFTMNPLTP
ncbi:hypothetical protein M9H77_12721 [Catharanthus roseus]|uniref:Uncharacterized protein n=1 Tax=Catharanthus roseus TaxID=4058 RepID=A0ACC0BID6_CATRO|nr:hypothetical protein M9H77_12721 [Catharanthus roseus]